MLNESERMRNLAGLLNEGVSNKMFKAYLEAILFGETDDDDNPLDKNYTERDFDKKSLNKAKKDLNKFLSKAQKLLDADDVDDDQAGHDFYFTRQGHGVGFWDRDLEHGDELSKIAEKMGEIYVYVGDDGKLYID